MRLPGKTVEDVDKKGLSTVDRSSLTFATNLDIPSVLGDGQNDMLTLEKVSVKLILGGNDDINNVPFNEMRESKNIYIFGREFADIFRALGDMGLDKNTIGRLLFKLTKIDFSSEKEKIALANYIQSLKNNKVKQLEEIEGIKDNSNNKMINAIAPGDSATNIVNINRDTKPQINSILDKAKEEEIISKINRFYIDSNQKNTAIKSMLNISEFFGDDLELYEFYVDILSDISLEYSNELFDDLYEISSIFSENRTEVVAELYNIDLKTLFKNKKDVIIKIINILKKIDLSRGREKITSNTLLIYLNNLEKFNSEYAETNLMHSEILDGDKEFKAVISILETDLPHVLKLSLKKNFVKLYYYVGKNFDKMNEIVELSEKYGVEFLNSVIRSSGALALEFDKTIKLLSAIFDKIEVINKKVNDIYHKYNNENDSYKKKLIYKNLNKIKNNRDLEEERIINILRESLEIIDKDIPIISNELFGKFAKRISKILGKNNTDKIIEGFSNYKIKDKFRRIRNKYKALGIVDDNFEKILNIMGHEKGMLNKFYDFIIKNKHIKNVPAILDSLIALKWIYEKDDELDIAKSGRRRHRMTSSDKFFAIATHLFKMLELNNGEKLIDKVRDNADTFDNIKVFKEFVKNLKRTA